MKMVVWSEIAQICNRIDFPKSATMCFERCYEQIFPKYAEDLQLFAGKWMSIDGNWRDCLKTISRIASDIGVSFNKASMFFLLYCAVLLRQEYKRKGLPESLFWDTLQDLRYKLLECYSLYKEWGTFVPEWYRGFYLCERFALGRLQYEKSVFPYKEYKGILKEGDRVYSCHIPSNGQLLETDVYLSLKKAYTFYQAELRNGILPIVCHSWLLYQPLETAFMNSRNILCFRNLFDVIENTADLKNGDFWRVFYREFSLQSLNEIEPTTSLQKNLKAYLLDGGTLGEGYGVLLFDGEKIIKL